jgi:hypothetical protein
VYSFSDVVAARIARDLRTAGVSLRGLRKAVRQLRREEFNHQSLAETRLIVSGKDVWLRDNEEFISMLRNPGQTQFPFTVLDLGNTVKAIRDDVEKLKAA